MKNTIKKVFMEALRAALAAIVASLTAGGISGCTTVNIPADDARCTTFNGGTLVTRE